MRTPSPTLVERISIGATEFFNNLAQELQDERNITRVRTRPVDPPPIGPGRPSFTVAGFERVRRGRGEHCLQGRDRFSTSIPNVAWIKGNPS